MNVNQPPRIIGLAGSFASGKDTLAHYLANELGWLHVSTGDMVRVEAQEKRGSIERPVLFEVANEARQAHGAGYFVQKALAKKDGYPGIIVSGIRSLGEAKAIQAAGGQVVFVDAPVQIRYERMKSRQRDNETDLTLEQFQAGEQKEWYSGPNDVDFNLRDIKKTADSSLENATTLEAFIDAARQQLNL